MQRLQLAIDQLKQVRQYSLALISEVPREYWFTMPAAKVTHVGWQVGHLAIAEYNLALSRIRDKRDDDETLIDFDEYTALFGRASTPHADPQRYPSPESILAVLGKVHDQVLAELPTLPLAELDQPAIGNPHRIVTTKLSSLLYCAQHEMLHVGQIGLLRRMLGASPRW